MIRAFLIALVIATIIHAGVLLFGGVFKFLLVKKEGVQKEEVREVEIVEEETKKPEKQEEREVKKVENVQEVPPDQMPDSTVLEELDQPAAPALAAVSLADLESALGGAGGGGDFGSGMSFSSGGVIGGTGAPGSGGDGDGGIGGGANDTKPRVLSSTKPQFPPALQKKGGSVTLIVFVGPDGRVTNAQVESATDPGMERPALDAVRAWTFEPATRGGRKVPSKIKLPIRLSPAR